MPTYTVKQGECLSSIADQFGLFWETIWGHATNQALRKLRSNPNVLMEGDVVFIPDKRTKEEICHTAKKHRFRVRGVPVKFVVRILDESGLPLSGARYTLIVDGKRFIGTVGPDGLITQTVPPSAQQALLTVHKNSFSPLDLEFRFALKHLNPVDDVIGLKARLKNLGFYSGELSAETGDALSQAVSQFQTSVGLEPTGQPGPATLDKLLAGHQS